MDFKIADASAFYAGTPFRSLEIFYTTSQVYEEIKHIKKNYDVLGVLIESGRLKIKDPEPSNTDFVIKKSKETGDLSQLSKEDISILALCVETKGELITDDFAISNVAKNLGIEVFPIMTSGIKNVGKWIQYCQACRKRFTEGRECPICGLPFTKKLINKN